MYTSICSLLWLLCMPTLRYLEIVLSRENLMLSIQAGHKSWDARIKCCSTALSCQRILCAMHWMSFLVAHILLLCNILYQTNFKRAKYGPHWPCLLFGQSSTALALTWKIVFLSLYAVYMLLSSNLVVFIKSFCCLSSSFVIFFYHSHMIWGPAVIV